MIEDRNSDQLLKLVYPPLAEYWIQIRAKYYERLGLQMRVTHGLRTFQEQWNIYAQGRKRIGNDWIITDMKKVVSYALPGDSFHNYGLALDIAFMGRDPYLEKMKPQDFKLAWEEYGRMATGKGLEWGGSWPGKKKDRPHIQMSCGLSKSAIQMVYERDGLDGVYVKCSHQLICGRGARK